MQQQYFKTMNQTNFSSKKLNSSKPINNTAKNNFNSHNSSRDIELTDQQASSFKARLPAEFRLIKLNTDQLQKAKEEARTLFLRTKSSLEKFHSLKSKKTVKKIQEKPKQVNQIHNQKVSSRQIEKLLEPEKQKKIKKQNHLKKRVSHKINDKKDQNHEQMESESEGSQQQFHVNELKTIRQVKQEFAQKNRKKKQKQKQKQIDDKDKLKEKEKQKEKKTLKQNKELIKDPNLERVQIIENFEQNIVTNQVNPLVKESTKSQKNYYASPSFPTLPSGLPRHIPIPNDQPEGTVQSNNLRFLFGLPYFGGMSEQTNKLSEKQKNFCTNIVQKLKAHRSSQAFRVPVDPEVQGVPDYYYVVYNPMDLGSIWKKLLKDKYQDIYEFHSDINLIFHNSYKYNLRSTKYFEAAVQFEDYYQTLLKEADDKPDQYAKQYIPKQLKPKLDTGELDYTEQTPLKKKKKRELDQIRNMQGYLSNKYEFVENRRVRGKSKSGADDHSAFYTHSMVLQTVNQFHGQMEMDNETKNYPNFNSFNNQKQKCQESQIPRVKKMESMKITGSSEEIIPEKEQIKQKCKTQQNFRNTFGKVQNDIIKPNLKSSSTSFPSVPINFSQPPAILEKVEDHEMIEQKQVQVNKNNKNSINMALPKKIMNKAQKNKGKRNMNGMIGPVENNGQENKNEQEKRFPNTQQRMVNEDKQSIEKMEQQEMEQKRAIEQEEENMKMNKVQPQNIHEFAYGHFLNPHQGYNFYNQYNPHYNNYLMLDRRNLGSDDDYDQMGANQHHFIHDMGYENVYQDYGNYYEKFQPYQLSNNVQLPHNTLQHQAKYEPNPIVPKQEIKEDTGKKKKRNIMKFPPKQNPSEIIPSKQQISQVKQIKNEQNNKQKKLEKQEKMNIKEVITTKQAEKNMVEFQPLEGQNQFNVEQQMEKSNANLNKKDKKKQEQQYNPKNTPFYNFGYKKIKNSHENITINNINEHPPVYSQKHQSGNSNQNIDINMIIYQNTEHQNYSGSTVASNLPVPSRHPEQNPYTYPQITKKQISSVINNSTDNANIDNANSNKVKSKKSKRKRDEQYQCSSDDEEYNMEEEWKLIRKSQTRQPTRKFKPKINKQKSIAQRENNRRGRYGKKIQPSIFDKNSLNLSNTEQTKNVHQNQTNQNSNKQYVQGSNMVAGSKDLVKNVKFQEEIPKNIFIESEHESSHFSKRELNLQDYMGQLMNHQEDIIAHSKEILDYSVHERKEQKLLKEENIYEDEYSEEKQGQSLDNRGQYGEMEVELKQVQDN